MRPSDVPRAVAAGVATATALRLRVDDAIVLHDSNKLTVRLLPSDVVARVAPRDEQVARFEIDLALRLGDAGCPVAAPDPRVEARVHERDGFVITLWTYYEPASPDVSAAGYADALRQLHHGMRSLEVASPHFTDRVEEAQRLLARLDRTPTLADPDRQLLADTLRTLRRRVVERGATDQLLHGEPHRGNLLTTEDGPRFIDLETCCRGPVEFDLAHAPEDVDAHYPGIDRQLLRDCRTLVLAMITTWRWDRGDRFPDGRRLATELLGQLRASLHQDRIC